MSERQPNQGMEGFASRLLVENRVGDAFRVLDTACRSANRHQLAFKLLDYLLTYCNRSQSKTVSYLVDEVATLPPALEAKLREKEQAMYAKFHDPDGIARVLRRLDRLDGTI